MKTEQQMYLPSREHYLRDWVLIQGVEKVKRPYALLFKTRKRPWNKKSCELVKYPANSLGYQLGHFLKTNDFELMDKLEEHDVMHVLLGLETTVEDEAIMQWVLLGNGKRSIFCVFTAILCWVLIPKLRKELLKNYRMAKGMKPFHKWKFEYLLREPISVLRAMMHQAPIKNKVDLDNCKH